jgi:hypothetical protein
MDFAGGEVDVILCVNCFGAFLGVGFVLGNFSKKQIEKIIVILHS